MEGSMPTNKPKRKRDYKAEYKRRIERGLAKGYSLSQARGHPTSKEKHVGKTRPIPAEKFQISLKALRSGKSLKDAAREIRVSPERLRNQAKARGAIRKNKGRWTVVTRLSKEMLIYSNGEAYPITLDKPKEASKVGRYMSAVNKLMRSNDPTPLNPFKGKHATDYRSKKHVFETDPNALYRLAASGSETFEQVYRIVI